MHRDGLHSAAPEEAAPRLASDSHSEAALPHLRDLCNLRVQHHFRPSPHGLQAWHVHRLIRLSCHLPVQQVPLTDIDELDENWWFDEADDVPTPRAIAQHVRLMDAADLRWPVILSADGRVMDGMHRIAQALRLGHTHVAAVRFEVDPPPDHVDIDPDALDYG